MTTVNAPCSTYAHAGDVEIENIHGAAAGGSIVLEQMDNEIIREPLSYSKNTKKSLTSKESESQTESEKCLHASTSSGLDLCSVQPSRGLISRPAKRACSVDSSLHSEKVAPEKKKAIRYNGASIRLFQSALQEAQTKPREPKFMMAVKAAADAAEDVIKLCSMNGNFCLRSDKPSTRANKSKDEIYSDDSEKSIGPRPIKQHSTDQSHKKPRIGHDNQLCMDSRGSDGNILSDVKSDCHHEERTTRIREDFVDYHDAEGKGTKARHGNKQINEDVRTKDNCRENDKVSRLANPRQKFTTTCTNLSATPKPDGHQYAGNKRTFSDFVSQNQPHNNTINTTDTNTVNGDKNSNDGPGEFLVVEDSSFFHEHAPSMTAANAELHQDAINKLLKPAEAGQEITKLTPSSVSTGDVPQLRNLDKVISRVIFVTNIHFNASKESVMDHFSSCGEINRILMLTDGVTGRPKGSAYIQYKTSNAADSAIALNGSCFYSRALKVVRKGATVAKEKTNQFIRPALVSGHALELHPQAKVHRSSAYPLPGGFPPAMPRPHRSLQWRRDATSNTLQYMKMDSKVQILLEHGLHSQLYMNPRSPPGRP
ncbi:hypothetical protein KP509_34G045800 [Ceratopteris richardii]|uniref:RRM domain-containing protein n=1 Tax=Ceratopteris richardii TaxID=49495 RepID=A0A8T2QK30_CERRI|nr:hypothetical protein KP509_1Z089900 [Ceratopteris richardii]KAH7284259.1 hypothetical protein KP509_34G045800 [Ceratopteris richardii]